MSIFDRYSECRESVNLHIICAIVRAKSELRISIECIYFRIDKVISMVVERNLW